MWRIADPFSSATYNTFFLSFIHIDHFISQAQQKVQVSLSSFITLYCENMLSILLKGTGTMHITEQYGLLVMLQICIWEVLSPNLGWNTGYPK
jgi:hypothetical protein